MLIFSFVRVGEAAVPGPPAVWNLGVVNPTGLAGKELLVSQLPWGLHAVSETHLTSAGLRGFRAGLRYNGSHIRNVVHGFHPPLRAHSSVVAKHSGVAFLSSAPCRPLCHDWPDDAFRSARIQAVSALFGDVWVQGATVYGYASRINSHPTEALTDGLLNLAVRRIAIESVGPRFISGDWNAEPSHLDSVRLLESYGFREAQEIARERWGKEVEMTYNNKTRIDFMYLSPELQAHLVHVWLEHDWFSGHAALLASFRWYAEHPFRTIWRVPQRHPEAAALLGPLDAGEIGDASALHPNPSDKYSSIWNAYESTLARVLDERNHKLGQSQGGRAQTIDIKVVKHCAVPIKPPRQGDFRHEFFGFSHRHMHWTRQLRRLQHFERLSRSSSPGGISEKPMQWRAILNAPGFGDSFSHWWAMTFDAVPEVLSLLPVWPPDADTSHLIWEAFLVEFRAFESQLCSARKNRAVQRRREDPAVIFKDLRGTQAEPVETLVQAQSAVVADVDAAEHAVVLECPTQFNDQIPVCTAGRAIEVIHSEGDKLWLAETQGIKKGARVRQEFAKGDLPSLFLAFGQEWAARWQKHDDVDPASWTPFIEQIVPLLPSEPLTLEPLTLAEWKSAVAQKKSKTAVGPDGIDKLDLQLLPDSLSQQLVDLCNGAEAGHGWPSQALDGLILAVAKSINATQVTHYRPICVLSLTYRTWGSIRSRQILRHLSALVPADLIGSMPSRTASSVWFMMQRCLERAHLYDSHTCGAVADLVKAFNLLPRMPVYVMARAMGISKQIVFAWGSALAALKRRFKLSGSVGPSLRSSTGFPEGDGMSCVAMVIIATAFHVWIGSQAPLCRAISYVDNWQLVAPSVDVLAAGRTALASFCDALDLQVDWHKTYVWGSSSAMRAALKRWDLPLVQHSKDLGGYMSYSRKAHVIDLKKKWTDANCLWQKLRASLAPLAIKFRALRVAAWPKFLHGCPNVHLSNDSYASLRAGAMSGLGLDKPGANAKLQLGLTLPALHDPQCFAIWQSFKCLREFGVRDDICVDLQLLLDDPACRFSPGPLWTFVCHLHTLSWTWLTTEGLVQDRWGAFDLWQIPIQELEYRMTESWRTIVGLELQERRGFSGLGTVDFVASESCLDGLSLEHQGLIRTLRNGTFFTQDALKHTDGTHNDACLHCSAPDSIAHRIWECPIFSEVRRPYLEGMADGGDLPDCARLHTWLPMVDGFLDYQCQLLQVEDMSHALEPTVPCSLMNLFTDGSCFDSHDVRLRVAAWAVLQAPVDIDGVPTVIGCGKVPGLIQTALRGELWAMIAAVRCARRNQAPTRIWADNLLVVRKAQAYIQGRAQPKINAKDSDLWMLLWKLLRDCHGKVSVHKVVAHGRGAQQDVADDWGVRYNSAVDAAAKSANLDRPASFWTMRDELQKRCEVQEKVGRNLVALHCAVGEASINRLRRNRPQLPVRERPLVEDPLWTPIPPDLAVPEVCTGIYGETMARQLWQWFKAISTSGARQMHLSFVQLYVDWQMASGLVGPVYDVDRHRWVNPNLPDSAKFRGHDAFLMTKWFGRALRDIMKRAGFPLQCKFSRPESTSLLNWQTCCQIPYGDARLRAVDAWLKVHLPAGVSRRRGAATRFLPLVARDDCMAVPFVMPANRRIDDFFPVAG